MREPRKHATKPKNQVAVVAAADVVVVVDVVVPIAVVIMVVRIT